MNSQNIFDPNDFNTIETSSQMYYLEVDGQNIIESPVASQAVPLNVLLNSHSDQFYTFIKDRQQNEQLCVYEDPMEVVDDLTLLNHINNQSYLPSNGNTLTLPIAAEVSSSSHLSVNNTLLPTPSTSCKISTDIEVQNNTKECKGLENDKNKKRTTSRVQGFVHLSDRVVPPRAVAVLPAALQMRRERVMPKRPLPERVRFGPVQGIINTISCSKAHDMVLEAANSKTPLFLLKSDDCIKHIDVSDRDKANWFCLLPLGTQSTANVWLFEEDNKLYGITIHSLTTQTKLALGYSKQYSEDHNLPPGLPVLDLNQDLPEVPRRWWCYDCHRALPTASQLQLHVDTYHKEKMTSMRRYRCRHCTRTFGRRFTLKRHIARYCCQRPDKSDTSIKTYTTPDVRQDTPLNVEDNRLPSDESLQNFTNGLDFSTNLFDTDRMPSLDISGSSRSEIEFNSYGIPYKDDNVLDLEMGKLVNDHDKTGNENQGKKQSASSEPLTMLISCPYCKQTIIREKKREHLRQCPERKFSCESCGVTYNSVEKLAQHIHSLHPDKNTLAKSSEKSEIDEANECEYKCETCQHKFKRRGMLVNHMWRVHKVAAQVPLQKRVRHYPCGACPKLYRSAAKRNTHRAHHHPDADLTRGEAIVSGRRACEPAACEGCPRQYATRAKLLQHVRQRHPHLAPPLKISPSAKACAQDRQKLTKRSASLEEDV